MEPRTKYLLDWVATLSTFKGHTPTLDQFKDGHLLGRILREVIDPSYFRELTDPTLVKTLDMMKKYFSEQVGQKMPSNLLPNYGKILSTGDSREIGKLFQLLLGCAVNCPDKAVFITEIRKMEDRAQEEIKESLEELLRRDERENIFIPDTQYDTDSRIMSLQETIDDLSQQNHELRGQISHIREEKMALASENDRLSTQLSSHMNDPESIHMTMKYQEETKKEVEKLREENYKLEASMDDFKLRVQVLEKQLSEAHTRMLSSTRSAEDISALKDQMDELREAAGKVEPLEASLRNYKKKLEEMAFLKNSIKALEEKNEELHTTNIHLEDEMKKVGGLKSQVEAVKKELTETQQRLSNETQRAMKAEFDYRLVREKHETAQVAASRLSEEKSRLTEQLDELRLSNEQVDMANMPAGNGVDSIELLPPLVRQKLVRLELENKKLNEKINDSIVSGSAGEGSKVLVEQLRKHEAELDEQLLTKTQELLDFQSLSDEKIRRLEAQLLEKDEELKKKKLQYEKCMDKAKSVIDSLEPTAAAALDSKSDPEKEKANAIREREEKLMASMFYNLSLQLHRNNVETRNGTFLQRQRQASSSSRRKSEM